MTGTDRLWVLLTLLVAFTATCGYKLAPGRKNGSSARSSMGRDIIVVFTETYGFPGTLALELSSYDKPCVVQVTVPSPYFNKTVLLAKNSTAEVVLNREFMLSEGEKSNKLVMVSSDAEISVVAFNTASNTADATFCLSKQDLGTEYYVFTSGQGQSNHFAVGNGEDTETQVNITVAGSLVYRGITYTNKQAFLVTLGRQEVILLGSRTDLTGTRVASSTPVAVFSGNKCYTATVGSCDIQFEQLYPVQRWGQTFVVFPLMTKESKDIISIIPAQSDTSVEILDKGKTTKYLLQPGSPIWTYIDTPKLVNATKPIMIGYLFQGDVSPFGYTFDPFSTTIPPSSFSSKYYKFVTQEYYYSYLFIVSRASSPSAFLLDHRPLTQNEVTMHHLEGFTGFQIELGKTGGQHEIAHPYEAFAIYVYGVESFISYGYSLGQADPYSGPEEAPELVCLAHQAEYRLPMSLVTDAELSIQDIHLNSPECGAWEEGRWAVITVPFDSCGSKVIILINVHFRQIVDLRDICKNLTFYDLIGIFEKLNGTIVCYQGGISNQVYHAAWVTSGRHMRKTRVQGYFSCWFGGNGEVEDGQTVYTNNIYGTVPNTTVHRIEVPLRCEMVGNETLGFQFHPMVTDKVAVGHHNLSLEIFESEAFNDPITMFPFEIDVHGNLYVEFKVESDDENLQILVEDCNSSPSLSPGETTYSILKHGCPQDTTLHAYPSGDQREQRYGFHVFKFGESPEVYLLCDIIICHNDSSPNRCTQGCSAGRHKRDLSSSSRHLQSARLSQGPIVFKSAGSLRPEGYREQQTLTSNGAFIGALCGIGLLAALALTVQRRYYRRQTQGYISLHSGEE